MAGTLGRLASAAHELAAEHRLQSKNLEEVAGHRHAAQRLAAFGEHEEVERPAIQRRRLDRVLLIRQSIHWPMVGACVYG